VSLAVAGAGAPALPARAADFLQLTKPRITLLVVLTTLVGFLEGSARPRDIELLLHTLLGTALVAAAASALNQLAERRSDALMRRTMSRPLAAGRMGAAQAAAFGLVLLAAGTAYLVLAVNDLAAALALLTAASYLLAYTPLKKVTSLATVIGAVPGAIPPMIGWAAARGTLDAGAWILFGIVFFWQMPHFLAIAVLYRKDYERAGFRVLPVADPDGRSTGRQALLYAATLLPLSLLPSFVGLAGPWYFAGALVLGALFVAASARLLARPGDVARARSLFRLSLVYLPVLFLLLTTG